MLSKFSSVPTRTEGFIHTMKAVENQTVGWTELLPKIIHDEQELRAAAILCSHSNVRPFFHPCRITVTEDGMFIKIEMHRRTQPQHIAVDDIVAVDHELPATFGVEELGNPLCGVRFTIKLNTEKTYVFYARTQADRVQWSDWLQNIVSRKRENERNYFLKKNQQRVERGTIEYERDILNMKDRDDRQAAAFLRKDAASGHEVGGPIFLGSSRDSPLRRGSPSRGSSPRRDAPGSLGPLQSPPASKLRRSSPKQATPASPIRDFTLPLEYDLLGNPKSGEDIAQAQFTRDHSLSGYLLKNPSLDLAPDAGNSNDTLHTNKAISKPVGSFRLVDRMSPVQRRLDNELLTNQETEPEEVGRAKKALLPQNSTLIVEKHSGEERHYDTDSMAHAQLAPVLLEDDVPTNRHLMWRYSPAQMKLWSECSVERHEQMRQLKDLKCPGRWNEFGQTSASQKKYADQGNIQGGDLLASTSAGSGALTGGRKIPTAKEVMGGLSKENNNGSKGGGNRYLADNATLNSSEVVGDSSHTREVSKGDGLLLQSLGSEELQGFSRSVTPEISAPSHHDGEHSYDGGGVLISPSKNTLIQSHDLDAHFPWISLDDAFLTYEEQMNLLLKLASTRVDDRYLYNPPSAIAHSEYGGRDVLVSQFDGELDHYPLPRGLASEEVKPHLDALYEDARKGVDALKDSLFERVGVVRHAAPINRRELRTAHDLSRYEKSIAAPTASSPSQSLGAEDKKVDILQWAEETYQKEEAAKQVKRRREEERQQLLETQRRAKETQANSKGQKVIQRVKDSDVGQFASFLM